MFLGLIAGGAAVFLALRWMHWRHHGHHARWGHPPWQEGSVGAWRRWRLRPLFERMEATPAQEKVLLEAWEKVEGAWEALRREWHGWAEDAARSVQGEKFDGQPLRERFARQDATLEELRRILLGSLAQAHEALQPDQRRHLASAFDLLARWQTVAAGGPGRCGRRSH